MSDILHFKKICKLFQDFATTETALLADWKQISQAMVMTYVYSGIWI